MCPFRMEGKQFPTVWGNDVRKRPMWISCYSHSMYGSRTPGWLIAAEIVSHLACCSHLIPQPRGILRHMRGAGWLWTPVKNETVEEPSFVNETTQPLKTDWSKWAWNVISTDPMTNIVDTMTRVFSEPPVTTKENKTKPVDTSESCQFKTTPKKGPGITDALEFMSLAGLCFLVVWIPGTYRAMPTGPIGVWAMGAVGALCVTIGAGICCLLCRWDLTQRIGVCASIHLSAQHIMSIWNVCRTCPSSPMHGHSSGIQQAICALFIAAVLFRVSHGSPEGIGGFDELEFYASHAWAIACVETIRALVHAPILCVML